VMSPTILNVFILVLLSNTRMTATLDADHKDRYHTKTQKNEQLHKDGSIGNIVNLHRIKRETPRPSKEHKLPVETSLSSISSKANGVPLSLQSPSALSTSTSSTTSTTSQSLSYSDLIFPGSIAPYSLNHFDPSLTSSTVSKLIKDSSQSLTSSTSLQSMNESAPILSNSQPWNYSTSSLTSSTTSHSMTDSTPNLTSSVTQKILIDSTSSLLGSTTPNPQNKSVLTTHNTKVITSTLCKTCSTASNINSQTSSSMTNPLIPTAAESLTLTTGKPTFSNWFLEIAAEIQSINETPLVSAQKSFLKQVGELLELLSISNTVKKLSLRYEDHRWKGSAFIVKRSLNDTVPSSTASTVLSSINHSNSILRNSTASIFFNDSSPSFTSSAVAQSMNDSTLHFRRSTTLQPLNDSTLSLAEVKQNRTPTTNVVVVDQTMILIRPYCNLNTENSINGTASEVIAALLTDMKDSSNLNNIETLLCVKIMIEEINDEIKDKNITVTNITDVINAANELKVQVESILNSTKSSATDANYTSLDDSTTTSSNSSINMTDLEPGQTPTTSEITNTPIPDDIDSGDSGGGGDGGSGGG
ncbi:unnamed protein product, partial [Meganyctiphanes norvegica]